MAPYRLWTAFFLAQAMLGAAPAAPPDPMLPATTPPIVYTINYSGEYFKTPEYIEQFRAAPPELLHVGKAVPILHHWGPVRLYQGENQYTGGPGHTLSRENIALMTPEQLADRIETIRRTLKRYHGIGIREITPYISYHTLAGDHEKREGFWAFYDRWAAYARWAGPRPEHEPLDWLVVDARGQFVGGSCGGYSPDYYAPLHRYRACINHPDWAEWHRRLIGMVAGVGYDGCFVDNAHPDPCYCRYCKALFQKFLEENRDCDWVVRLAEGLDVDRLEDVDRLALDSPDVPAELVRRWRVLRTGEHLGMLRRTGRETKPGFTIFPNSGRIDECLTVGGQCDRLMFESTFSPGLLAEDEPPPSQFIAVVVSAGPVEPKRFTHRFELNDPATFVELAADISIPTTARVGKPVELKVHVTSVGASLLDGDAAEDFYLLLREVESGVQARVELEPRGPIGGSSSSRKPRQPPVELAATWTPPQPGCYWAHFGFRYTDDSHRPEASLKPHLVRLDRGKICRTHQAELLFTQHMHARAIYLGYEAYRKGWENVQDLALAEMAAFSGGGGFSGRGGPQAKYRAFFKKHPELFDGWRPTAPAAVLYAYWGPNPLSAQRPLGQPLIQEELAAGHRLFVALVDASLPTTADELSAFESLYLQSPRYEISPAQLDALRGFLGQGGRVLLADPEITVNGLPAEKLLARATVWDWDLGERLMPRQSIAPSDGLRRNLRFGLYRKGDRLALHAVNYNVCLLDEARRVIRVEPTPLEVPVPQGWTAATATCFDPDAEPVRLRCTVAERTARLVLPAMRIYKIVLLERG